MSKKILISVIIIVLLMSAVFFYLNKFVTLKEGKVSGFYNATNQYDPASPEDEFKDYLVNQVNLETNEDFINFAKEGDKAEFVVRAVLNPALVESFGLKPVQVNVRQDVYKIMGKYWKEEYVEKTWKSGSSMMPNEPFGFRMGDGSRLLFAKNIQMESKTENKVIVTGDILYWGIGDEYWTIIYTLEHTENGWKIISKSGRKAEAENKTY